MSCDSCRCPRGNQGPLGPSGLSIFAENTLSVSKNWNGAIDSDFQFFSIGAAVAHAGTLAGATTPVLILVYPGTYIEDITNVNLNNIFINGLTEKAVIIQGDVSHVNSTGAQVIDLENLVITGTLSLVISNSVLSTVNLTNVIAGNLVNDIGLNSVCSYKLVKIIGSTTMPKGFCNGSWYNFETSDFTITNTVATSTLGLFIFACIINGNLSIAGTGGSNAALNLLGGYILGTSTVSNTANVLRAWCCKFIGSLTVDANSFATILGSVHGTLAGTGQIDRSIFAGTGPYVTAGTGQTISPPFSNNNYSVAVQSSTPSSLTAIVTNKLASSFTVTPNADGVWFYQVIRTTSGI